jgi:conjugative relaxase-like TrwC/TraI family protein
MLSITKVYAGRGAVDYYLAQTRRGIAGYYLPEDVPETGDEDRSRSEPVAPGTAWWGGGTGVLDLDGEVARAEFEPLYAEGVRPDGSRLGTRFRTQERAAEVRAEALAATDRIDDPYDRWHARHSARTGAARPSVAAWDCTFSPVKSVSLLWAFGSPDVQAQVWAAHLTAVDAGLGYLEDHAAYVRAGRDGVRILDTSGLVVARMNEWSSRDGDPQLHTHCLVLNRAEATDDGKWRALDGRPLLAAKPGAGALYNRVLEAELTRRLGVVWRDREDGLREIDGIDDDLIDLYSSRRRAIADRLDRLVAAHEAEHGAAPSPAVRWRMAQHATLTTRPTKELLEGGSAVADWRATAMAAGRDVSRQADAVTGRHADAAPATVESTRLTVARMLDHLAESGRATYSRHDLLRAALDVVQVQGLSPAAVRVRAESLVRQAITSPQLLSLTPPDPLDVPDELRRLDGSSVYQRVDGGRWALRATLDREAWLLDVAVESGAPGLGEDGVRRPVARHDLGADQAAAADELLRDDRRVHLLVGPAGAGKTRTLRAVTDAWRSAGGDVIGLTVSQAAAEVLAAEADVRAENTAKWLYETRRGRSQLPAGALVLVDEATMLPTDDLVQIIDQARQVGGRVILVGDPAQLGPVEAGGAFELLADRHGSVELQEVRRFTEPWEADASLKLRQRDPAALAAYAMRARIHGGDTDELVDELFAAWRADAIGVRDDGRHPSALMVAATNEQAAELSARAQAELIRLGLVDGAGGVMLADNEAGLGDHIITRRNDRRTRTSADGWVTNGDVWTVIGRHPSGAAVVRRHRDGDTAVLPADYLARHAHLAYAITAHRAQGVTVDRCHALVTADTSHERLYVSATRGREANHLWVATDTAGAARYRGTPPSPEQVLAQVLRRRDTDRLSAHQMLADLQEEVCSLHRLGAIFEDAAGKATEAWLARVIHRTAELTTSISDDSEWPTLIDRVRGLALAGHDAEQLVKTAIRMRPLDSARSAAAVLHWRLGQLAGDTVARSGEGLAWIPDSPSPYAAVARQAADLIAARWQEIRQRAKTMDGPPVWAPSLGAMPADRNDAAHWVEAVTAIWVYREQYAIPDHVPLLGKRPSDTRPDAQAAYDLARAVADRHLARHLHNLTPDDLADLAARQQAILDARPSFDPFELEEARRALDVADRAARHSPGAERSGAVGDRMTAARRVAILEAQAAAYERWRGDADTAQEVLRQIDGTVRSRVNVDYLARR